MNKVEIRKQYERLRCPVCDMGLPLDGPDAAGDSCPQCTRNEEFQDVIGTLEHESWEATLMVDEDDVEGLESEPNIEVIG